jgi:hypothetical protein
MIAISEIKIYDILTNKFKLKDTDAKEIIAEIVIANEKIDVKVTEKIEDRFKSLKEIFLTKDDKVDMIKWMFAFWVTLILMIIGLYIKK